MFFTFQDYLPPDIELPQREQPLMQGLHEHVYWKPHGWPLTVTGMTRRFCRAGCEIVPA